MQYQFEQNPEFHVWDLGSYDSLDTRALFQSSWMGKYLRPGDRVMDIGCGPGYGVKVLKENGYSVLGVDLNEVLVTRAVACGLNVIKQDALQAVRERAADFDVFCMSDFIEHVPLPVVIELCGEIAKKPGARLYLCTPNLDSVMGFKFWFHMPTHVNPMHPFVIRKMLLAQGYEIIEEWSEYGNLPGRGWKLRLRKWLLAKLLGPTQAQLFLGGANVCFFARAKSA